jgi:aspartate dehydrogenase
VSAAETRVSVAGLGAVGRELVRHLSDGIDGLALVAASAADHDKATRTLSQLGANVPVVALEDLEPVSDLVVECIPASLVPQLTESVVSAGKEIVMLSAGVLLTHPELVDLAERHAGKITVPTGALLGLDAVGAAAEGAIHSVKMISRKPPQGLAKAPHLERSGIDAGEVTEPTLAFSGSAREAAEGFPANLNIAAALALAGIGPELTQVEMWIDPTVTRNTHRVEVRSEAADFTLTIENVPSENPRTGRITALSVLRLLRKRAGALAVGT